MVCCKNKLILYSDQCGNVCSNCGECDFIFEPATLRDWTGYVIKHNYKNMHHIVHFLNCLQGFENGTTSKYDFKKKFYGVYEINDIKKCINNQVLRKYLTYIYCIINNIPQLRIQYKDYDFIKMKILSVCRHFNSNGKRCPHYSYIMLILIDKYPYLDYIKPYIFYKRKDNRMYNVIYKDLI